MTELLVLIGISLVLALWVYIFMRWKRGIYGLLVYMPFAGAITLFLYPSPIPILFKDIFFIIPAYLSYFLRQSNGRSHGRIPHTITLTMLALSLIVFIQMFNPSVANLMVVLIGAKVWLFYLPITYLAFSMLKTQGDLVKLCRLLVVIAWVPCIVGIAQWLLSMTFGYMRTMEAFYGAAAKAATQGFASFQVGGTFFRIPSTFTFVTQYFGFTLAMIVPAFILTAFEYSAVWRRFANVSLGLIIMASFLSGARSAYVFVPLLLMLIYVFDGKGRGLIKMIFFTPLILLTALDIGGIDFDKMFNMMSDLTNHYSKGIATQGLIDSIQVAPLGLGTGVNTSAARYGFEDSSDFIAVENYYAKAVMELGILGLLLVTGLFLALITQGYLTFRRLKDKKLKSTAAAILAFIITITLISFKGWIIDIDPINIYFWLFSGFLFKLKYLNSSNRVFKEQTHHGVNTALVKPRIYTSKSEFGLRTRI